MQRKQVSSTVLCFWCELNKNQGEQFKKFARYVKVLVSENNDIIAYKLYGNKIIENKGLPLIKSDFIANDIQLDGSVEQLISLIFQIPVQIIDKAIEKLTMIDERIFNFLIEQHQ